MGYIEINIGFLFLWNLINSSYNALFHCWEYCQPENPCNKIYAEQVLFWMLLLLQVTSPHSSDCSTRALFGQYFHPWVPWDQPTVAVCNCPQAHTFGCTNCRTYWDPYTRGSRPRDPCTLSSSLRGLCTNHRQCIYPLLSYPPCAYGEDTGVYTCPSQDPRAC